MAMKSYCDFCGVEKPKDDDTSRPGWLFVSTRGAELDFCRTEHMFSYLGRWRGVPDMPGVEYNASFNPPILRRVIVQELSEREVDIIHQYMQQNAVRDRIRKDEREGVGKYPNEVIHEQP